MKDQFGKDMPEAEFHNPHGQKVNHKGELVQKVTDGLKKAADAVKHVIEVPFHGHEEKADEPAKEAEKAE